MEVQCLSSDIISILPNDIIERILCVLPIKDAVRTSILSSKWRYSWTTIPILVFDDKSFEVSSDSKQDKKSKFFGAIFHVLLFHRGPILQFGLYIRELIMTPEVDQIILHLSMNNTLKSFFIVNKLNNLYELPSSLSSLQGLEDLVLKSCAFELPSTFNGLSKLRSLSLSHVRITAKMLQRRLINCPQIEKFVLMECYQGFTKENKITLIVHLEIGEVYVVDLAIGGMPSKLLTTLVHLEVIHLDVCFRVQDEISALLYLIRSSPNLKKISILMSEVDGLVQQPAINFPVVEDYSSYNLNYLKELKIKDFHNFPFEMEFMKLVMAKAPVLEKARIKLDSTLSVDEELKLLRGLIRRPVPKASPSAELIIE